MGVCAITGRRSRRIVNSAAFGKIVHPKFAQRLIQDQVAVGNYHHSEFT
jgi:hypothetical protein